jgi:CTP:molybdopterin cytidylyltransferase MocA
MTKLSAVVLAAGEGRRMGGATALLEIDGRTLVEHHAERLTEVGCSSIVVVVPPAAARAVTERLLSHRVVHIAAAATASQADSLAAGLRVLAGASGDVVVVTPVDMVPAQRGTHHALLAALTSGTAVAVTPVYRGRGGHPVVVRRSMLAPYEERGLPGSTLALPPLRDVLAEAGDARRRVEVDDENVLGDLDTPADLRALLSR